MNDLDVQTEYWDGAAAFNIANYSTSSSIIVKMKECRKVDKGLRKRLLQMDQVIFGQKPYLTTNPFDYSGTESSLILRTTKSEGLKE